MSSAIQQIFSAGEQQILAGNAAGALDSYRRFLTERMSGRGAGATPSALDMVAMERLADLATLLGQSGPAEDILEAMHGWFAGSGNRVAADYALIKQVSLGIARGRVRQAYEKLGSLAGLGELDDVEFTAPGLEEFERHASIAGSTGDRATLLSRVYLEMGRIQAANGQYESALAAARAGLRHCGSSAPDLAQQAAVPLRLLICAAAMEKGDLPAAEEALGDVLLRTNSGQPGFEVRAAELRGKVQLLRGALGAAKVSYEGVVGICRARGFQAAATCAGLNLAHVLIYLNQTSRARELLVQAIAAAPALGDDSLVVRAEYLLAIGASRAQSMAEGVRITPSIFEHWGQHSAGPSHAGAQWKNPFELPVGENYLALFEDRALGFHWHLASLDWERARAYLGELRAAFGETDSQLISLRLEMLEATLDYYRGEFVAAAARLEPLCPRFQRAGLLPELWQALRFLSWSCVRLGRAEAGQAVRAQADAALAVVSESLTGADRGMYHLNKWTAEEEFAAGEVERLARAARAAAASFPVQSAWRRWKVTQGVAALLGHVDRFHSGLTARFVEGAARGARRESSAARWLLGHARDEATLRFVVLPDSVLVVRAYRFSLTFGVCPITRIQVREGVRRWHEALLEGGGTQRANLVIEELAGALQIPAMIAGLPERVRRLTIIPDDSLYGVPFAAIRVGGQYLIEKYALSIGGAPQAETRGDRNFTGALAVGVAAGLPGMEELSGVADEIAEVSEWLRRRGFDACVMGGEATRTEVSRRLETAAVCHLACHGIFEPDSPDRSGVILGGAEEDRVLSVRVLAGLDLRGLRQIVLSSCWSADSFVLPGRWVISLPKILLYAGADSVIGSLWEVDDRLAQGFMRRFYRRLETMRRDEALRLTQLDCIRGEVKEADAADPIYWAGYALYGDSGRLTQPNKTR